MKCWPRDWIKVESEEEEEIVKMMAKTETKTNHLEHKWCEERMIGFTEEKAW